MAGVLERRERATRRHDAASGRFWPRRDAPEFRAEVEAVARELEDVLSAANAQHLPPVELSRTARWLADAYADLCAGESVGSADDLAWLAKAAATYQLAEQLLGDADAPRDRAVLDFNYANALRRFDVNDERLLEAAQQRYDRALRWFEANDASRAQQVRSARDSVLVLLRVAPLKRAVDRTRTDLARLGDALASGAPATEVDERFRAVVSGGGPPALGRKVADLVAQLPPSVRERDPDGKLQALVGHALQLATPPDSRLARNVSVLAALEERFARDVAERHIDPARQAALRSALDRLAGAMTTVRDDAPTLRGEMGDLREGMAALLDALKNASYGLPVPPPGSRAATARERLWDVRRAIFEELMQHGMTDGERRAGHDLAKRLVDVDRALVEADADDVRATAVERERARPQVVEARKHAARLRPYLVDPHWPSKPGPTAPNSVLLSGAEELTRVVERSCASYGLDVLEPPRDMQFADARWRQIAKAGVCLFDMRAPDGPARAAVAYELGVAQALGKSVIVLAYERQQLPFDLDVPVVEIGVRPDGDAIAAAAAAACYWIPARGTATSIADTVGEVCRRFGASSAGDVAGALRELERCASDPIAAGDAIEAVLAMARATKPMVIRPPWTAPYPDPASPRVFHVMPFGPAWANDAALAVEQAARATGHLYERGDRSTTPEIIDAIWRSICTASTVVVDLTGWNANVAFELGLCHVVGRRVLLVGQSGTAEALFPAIAKLRVTTYRPDDMNALERTAWSWLSER